MPTAAESLRAEESSIRKFFRRESSLVWFLVLLGIVLRLPNLGESLWLDEVLYSTSYWVASLSDLWKLFLSDTSAPLYRIFMFPWTRTFGEHELSVRMPSLLFGISSIPLTYWIARAYGSQAAAFLAVLLLCFSPAHVWYSQEATPYAMALFFLLGTVLAWLRLREAPVQKGWYVAYVSMFLAAVFTHYFAAVFIVPLTLMGFMAEKPLRRRMILAHALIVSCLALALGIKYLTGRIESGQVFLRPFTLFEWWMLFFNWFLHGNSLWTVSPYRARFGYVIGQPALLLCQLFFLVVFLRGLLPDRIHKNSPQAWELFLFLSTLPVVMLLLTQAGYRNLYIERYLLLLLPFLLVLQARGAVSFANRWAVRVTSIVLVVIGAASYGSFLYKSDTWTVYKQNPDWRSASHYLNGEGILTEKAIIFVQTEAESLEYYLRKKEGPHPEVKDYDAAEFERVLSVNGLRGFYLVKKGSWANFNKVFQRLKDDQRLLLVDARSFKGLELYTFRRQDS